MFIYIVYCVILWNISRKRNASSHNRVSITPPNVEKKIFTCMGFYVAGKSWIVSVLIHSKVVRQPTLNKA